MKVLRYNRFQKFGMETLQSLQQTNFCLKSRPLGAYSFSPSENRDDGKETRNKRHIQYRVSCTHRVIAEGFCGDVGNRT